MNEKIEDLKKIIIFQDKLIDELLDYIKLNSKGNTSDKKVITSLINQRLNLHDYIKSH